MITDQNRIYDGFEGLEGGVDGGRRANAIEVNQVESAENITFRGGKPVTRFSFEDRASNFLNPTNSYNADGSYAGNGVTVTNLTAQDIFNGGIFQGAHYFAPHNHEEESIVAMIGGRMFKIVPRRNTVDITEISLARRNRSNLTKAYFVQADKWLGIQDGESKPILFDNSSVRRAKEDEVVVGTIQAYGMGRWVVIRNNDIFFGDLYGSKANQEDPADAVIGFTETTFLSEGEPASITFELGRITGAAFFPQLDTSTGLGELMVYTDRGACSFFLSLARDQWKTSEFQKVALKTTGLSGWRSLSEVNEDQFLRSRDGVRSFRQARAEPRGWDHIPLSTNVEQFLDTDTPSLLEYGSSIYFDNRILQTCSPTWNQGRPYNAGLVVLDFNILSSFGQSVVRPAWDGHVSVDRITQLVTGLFNGVDRAFAFVIDSDTGFNQVIEIMPDGVADTDGQIPWEIVTRSFDFSRDKSATPFNEKELYGADIWFDEILDPANNLAVWYRPDGYNDWIPWPYKQLPNNLTPIVDSNDADFMGLPTQDENFFPRVTLEKPPDAFDATTNRNLRRGYEFQLKVSGQGHLGIVRMRIAAQQLIEESLA